MLAVNEYFDGKVKSIAFQALESKATIGVIQKGNYEFSTNQIEIMTIISGTLFVQLPNESNSMPYITGQSFRIESGKIFHVSADSDVSYICRYF